MSYLVLLAVIIFIILDQSLIYKHCPFYTKDHFFITRLSLLLFGLSMVVSIYVFKDVHYIPALFMVFILPIYLYRRVSFHRWLKENKDKVMVAPGEQDPSLAMDTLAIVLWWFLGTVLFSSAVHRLAKIFSFLSSELGETVVTSGFSLLFMVYLIAHMLKEYPQYRFWELIGMKGGRLNVFKAFILPVCIGILFAVLSSQIILSRVVQPRTPFSDIIESPSSLWVMVIFLIMAVVIAPFLEEIIFRGFLFFVVHKYHGERFAVLSIGGIFALMHYHQYWGDWMAIALITVLGIILTTLRAKTNSTIPSIVTHYTFNTVMTVIPVIMILLSNPSYFEYITRYDELKSQEKEELLLDSIHRRPDYLEAYNDLAWLYAEEGQKLNEAYRLIEKALYFDPGNGAYLDTKAEILYKMGRLEDAAAIGKILADKYPTNPYYAEQLNKFIEPP